jgi:hypothetical protein
MNNKLLISMFTNPFYSSFIPANAVFTFSKCWMAELLIQIFLILCVIISYEKFYEILKASKVYFQLYNNTT